MDDNKQQRPQVNPALKQCGKIDDGVQCTEDGRHQPVLVLNAGGRFTRQHVAARCELGIAFCEAHKPAVTAEMLIGKYGWQQLAAAARGAGRAAPRRDATGLEWKRVPWLFDTSAARDAAASADGVVSNAPAAEVASDGAAGGLEPVQLVTTGDRRASCGCHYRIDEQHALVLLQACSGGHFACWSRGEPPPAVLEHLQQVPLDVRPVLAGVDMASGRDEHVQITLEVREDGLHHVEAEQRTVAVPYQPPRVDPYLLVGKETA